MAQERGSVVEAILVDGEDALIGTALLDSTNLTIDYIADVVTIVNPEIT